MNDKLDNFNKLETTLRNLKIKFDSRMVNDIIKGKRDQYGNCWAVKQKEIPADLLSKWVKFFKTAKIVSE